MRVNNKYGKNKESLKERNSRFVIVIPTFATKTYAQTRCNCHVPSGKKGSINRYRLKLAQTIIYPGNYANVVDLLINRDIRTRIPACWEAKWRWNANTA